MPAEVPTTHLPVDLVWFSDGQAVAGDIKTAGDFIASYTDGRLHDQIKAMQDLSPRLHFIFLEGPLSTDGGYTIGNRNHGWDWKQFENAKMRLQDESGVKFYGPVPYKDQTPSGIAGLWNLTAKDNVGSWHIPEPLMPASNFKDGLIFFDETFRSHVGMLMHLPSMGPKRANNLRENHSLMELLGITEEGLEKARTQVWGPTDGVGPKLVRAWGSTCAGSSDPVGCAIHSPACSAVVL